MNEKVILLFSLFFSLGGLFALFLLSERIEYDEETIEKINAERLQDMLKIKGEVFSVSNVGNITFISLKQPSTIDIVVFDEVVVHKGEVLEVIGKSEEYKNEMEIIGHRIRVVR